MLVHYILPLLVVGSYFFNSPLAADDTLARAAGIFVPTPSLTGGWLSAVGSIDGPSFGGRFAGIPGSAATSIFIPILRRQTIYVTIRTPFVPPPVSAGAGRRHRKSRYPLDQASTISINIPTRSSNRPWVVVGAASCAFLPVSWNGTTAARAIGTAHHRAYEARRTPRTGTAGCLSSQNVEGRRICRGDAGRHG